MLAFITNLNLTEIAVIVVGAILVFGKDLPSVVMRGMQHLAKLRRAVKQMWSEAGLEQEMRRVRAEIDAEVPNISTPGKLLADGKSMVQNPVEAWRKNIEKELKDVVPAKPTGKQLSRPAAEQTPQEVTGEPQSKQSETTVEPSSGKVERPQNTDHPRGPDSPEPEAS